MYDAIEIDMVSSSSSSGAVFFEKVGCHGPPWLPILSNSHEVFVSHSRPFCDISNDCNFVIFLVVIVHVSHPYKSVDHTYAFIIIFLVFIRMCGAVIVFNIELNAPLAISIIFKISSSHFPFDVIVCPK